MKWALTEPRGVKVALAEPEPNLELFGEHYCSRFREPEPNALTSIGGSDALTAEDRLEIYAEAYFIRLHDALGLETFASTRAFLGDDAFRNIVAKFLAFNPSHYFNVEDVGAGLPQFLITQEELVAQLPFIVELADFEWQLNMTFFADKCVSMASEKIAHIEDWDSSRFLFSPAMRVLCYQYPVLELWQDGRSISESPLEASRSMEPTYVLIYRDQNYSVDAENISSEQYNVLKKLMQGEHLCEALAGIDESKANDLQAWFQHWMERKLICDIISTLTHP